MMLNFLLLALFLSRTQALFDEDHAEDPDSEAFEKYTNEFDRDEHIITHSIKKLIVRPDDEKYPYVIKVPTSTNDEVDKDKNEIMIKYVTPKIFPKKPDTEHGELGPNATEILIKTLYLDLSKDILVVPMGERGLGYPSKGQYVVLRKSGDKTKHYLNLAYIRKQMSSYAVEWSLLDTSLFNRNRIEQEYCRHIECELYHHLLGICGIVSHECKGLQGSPEVVNKWTWITNLEPGAELEDPLTLTLSLTPDQADKLSPKEGKSGKKRGKKHKSSDNEEEESRRKRREVQSDPEEKNHIPNSLDLLLLKRDDKEAAAGGEGTEEAHFANSLQKRGVNAGLLDCVGCEKLGEFFDDYEEDPAFSRLVGEQAGRFKAEISNDRNIGGQNEEVLQDRGELPYLGYGHCNLTELDEHMPNNTKEIEELGKFYLASLRLNCDQNSENKVRAMFTSKWKLLQIHEDFSVGLAHTSPILKYMLLNKEEWRSLLSATITARYIRLYREENLKFRTNVTVVPPMDKKVSKNINFFSKLLLAVMDSFAHKLSQHFIRGHRSILRILRDKFNTVLMSVVGDEEAPHKETLINDLYRIMALKEFVLYGLGPMKKSGTTAEPAFRSFVSDNEKRIKRLIASYGIL